jgi:prephenate dehydrogenase
MKVFIVGIGLIGGSLARDIKKMNPNTVVYGIDANENHLEEALKLGIIDRKATYNKLVKADTVFVCIPVNAMEKELPKILDRVGEYTLVMDMGSTKKNLCESVKNHTNRKNYLACHPIAGTEFSGPTAAILGLFKRKTMIICEEYKTKPEFVEGALGLFKSLGMRVRKMDPESHLTLWPNYLFYDRSKT